MKPVDTRGGALFYLRLVSVGILIFGSRLWLIHNYGSSVPFWDEWNGYVGRILIPWSQGQLHLGDLLQPHNEHRIFFTHLLALVMLALNRQADPILGMIFSAFLHTVTALFLIWLLARRRSNIPREGVVLGVFLLWAVPLNWHNILWAFQSSSYFLIFFSILAVWGLLLYGSSDFRWWIGVLSAGAACLSLGSGFLVAVVVVTVKAYLILVDREKRRSHLSSLLFCLVVVVVSLLVRATPESGESYKAAGLHAFLVSFGLTLAWPFQGRPWLAVLYLPFIVVAVRTVWARRRPSRDETVILALGGWVLLTSISIAYARGQGGVGPAVRYVDFLTIGVLCNLLSFWVIGRQWFGLPVKARPALPALASAWMIAMLIGMYTLFSTQTVKDIRIKRLQEKEQLANCRQYLLTGNPAALQGKPYLSVPFPWPEVLAGYLADPHFREYAPDVLATPRLLTPEPGYGQTFVDNGFFPTTGAYLGEDVIGSLHHGGEGNRPVGAFVSKPFCTGQAYLEIPVAGYLGEKGLSLYLIEDKLTPSDFQVYSFPLPRERIHALRLDPADEPSDIILRSIEVHVDQHVIPVPVKPRSLRPNGWISDLGQSKDGSVYRSLGEDPSFALTGLPDLDLSGAREADLRLEMWVSTGSHAQLYWDVGQGFQEPDSVRAATTESSSSLGRSGLDFPRQELTPVIPPRIAKESWVLCYARAPRNPIRLIAIDERDDSWFAFAMPRGVGRLSRFARALLRRSQLIIGVGVVLLLLGGGMAAFRGLASPAGHEEP